MALLEDDDEPDAEHDDTQVTQHSDHLVKMILGARQANEAAIKFLITVEGALGVGFGALVVTDRSSLRVALALIVCVFGAALSIGLVLIIERHSQWHAWFIKRYIALPGNLGKVFPGVVENDFLEKISDLDPGRVAKIVKMLGLLTVVGWALAAGLLAVIPVK